MELVRYDAMCHAINQAFEVDEVKDIRDKAMALEAYSRQARNTEAERRACEIRLRAERKVGELLSKWEKAHRGPDQNGQGSQRATSEQTLADLGISKNQSSKWQQLADVPKEQFEAALAAPERPTTSGILRAAQEPKRPPMDARALWLWGRLRDFERDGLLNAEPEDILDQMTDAMRADTLRLAPLVRDWFGGFTE